MKKIAILFGGPSKERDVSIKTADQIFQALQETEYYPTKIELTIDLKLMNDIYTLSWQDLKSFDFVYIAIHGDYGEDGKVQAILESYNIPYNGSDSKASNIGMDKLFTQNFLAEYGILSPKTTLITNELLGSIDLTDFPIPCVIKPNQAGSSVGVEVIHNQENLIGALEAVLKHNQQVLVQEYIQGKEFTCGVIKNQGENPLYILPPVEIIVDGDQFFDYNNKYNSTNTQEICPPNISNELMQKIIDISHTIHITLHCDGLTRSDFRYDIEKDELYFLEINTIPGQTEASLCPHEAKVIGKSFQTFVIDQIELGFKKFSF